MSDLSSCVIFYRVNSRHDGNRDSGNGLHDVWNRFRERVVCVWVSCVTRLCVCAPVV